MGGRWKQKIKRRNPDKRIIGTKWTGKNGRGKEKDAGQKKLWGNMNEKKDIKKKLWGNVNEKMDTEKELWGNVDEINAGRQTTQQQGGGQ